MTSRYHQQLRQHPGGLWHRGDRLLRHPPTSTAVRHRPSVKRPSRGKRRLPLRGNQQPKGAIYNENSCSTKIFNNNAYWFGHPCDTGTLGYDDAWANETLTIPNIDLTSMSGDFVSLNFEYYADTFYTIDQDGEVDPSDYATMTVITTRTAPTTPVWSSPSGTTTTRTEPVRTTTTATASSTPPNPLTKRNCLHRRPRQHRRQWQLQRVLQFRRIGEDHQHRPDAPVHPNRSSPDSSQWRAECMSLQGSTVDVHFDSSRTTTDETASTTASRALDSTTSPAGVHLRPDAVYTDSEPTSTPKKPPHRDRQPRVLLGRVSAGCQDRLRQHDVGKPGTTTTKSSPTTLSA